MSQHLLHHIPSCTLPDCTQHLLPLLRDPLLASVPVAFARLPSHPSNLDHHIAPSQPRHRLLLLVLNLLQLSSPCRDGAFRRCFELTSPSPTPCLPALRSGSAVYMRPNSSPPQEAEHVRHQSLTPESPRPQNVPSPANIPILVEHMDANYNDVSLSNTDSAAPSAPHFPQQAHSSSANANTSTPYFADQSATANFHTIGVQGGGHDAPGAFSQSTGFGGSMGTQPHDTSSMQNFTSQHQSRAASASDAQHASGQGLHSAYPYSHDNAYAAQHAPAQSTQGAHYQTGAHTGSNIDVQALLDSLTPAANNAPSTQYASAQVSTQSPQTQHHASSLPSATNLPARPPTQDKPATHPNYDPNDDIRSYHPQSQQAPNAQQKGNGSFQPMNVQNQEFSTTSAHAQQQPGERSETPDDEDQRWPPEVNRRYEEFLDQERKFVTEGQWDQFPMGSRLFIGEMGLFWHQGCA